MLIKRALAALIFAPALLFLLYIGGRPLEIACLGLGILMLGELASLVFWPRDRLMAFATVAFGILLGTSALGWLRAPGAGSLLVGGTLVLWLLVLADPEPLERAMSRVGLAVVGAIYGGILIAFLARLRSLNDGLTWGLMAVFGTWAADTGAYFVGRHLGRHKLYPKVSPGKTVEGLAGAIGGALAAIFLIRALWPVPVGVSGTVALGLIVSLVGTAGDLAESMLKRSVGAKDSSHIIPGHGGVLDRFDAILFVAPAMYCYLVWTVAN